MTDGDLIARAITAVMTYRCLYHLFPRKIGIHWNRLREMPHSSLVFPEIPMDASLFSLVAKGEDPRIHLHSIPLEGVRGFLIRWDEVYLPLWEPHDVIRIISAETLLKLHADQEGAVNG